MNDDEIKLEKVPSKKKKINVEGFINKKILPILQIVSANKYLRSLMEGFYVTLPIIVFSSIIGIIMWVPPALSGNPTLYSLPVRMAMNRIYIFTMGLVSIFFVAGIARSLAEKLNQQLPVGRKMNETMVIFAAISSIFMMSVTGTFTLNPDGTQTENFASITIDNLASQGMITSIIVGLTLPWIFYVPVRWNWTVRLPKAVPQGVSQSFADIIPFGLSVLVFWGVGYIFLSTMQISFTSALFQAIKPIFSGLDSYGFLAAIAFMTAAIWFIGVHGPSVTRPFVTPIMYTNLANNQQIFEQGGHPHFALTYEFSFDFTSTMGGTGATFVIPILLILFAKSKQLKAVGFASYIPIWFQVNEPALFGCPLILNPVVVLPFVIIPVINILIYKFFIDVFGMNAAIFDVPWSMPACIGLLIGSGFDPKVLILWSLLCLIDFVLWMPFVIVYDRVVCKQEIESAQARHLPLPLHYSYSTFLKLGILKTFNTKEHRLQYAGKFTEFNEERKANKAEHIEEKRAEKAAVLEQVAEEKRMRKEARLAKRNARKEIVDNNEVNTINDLKPSVSVQEITKKDEYNILVVCYGAGTSAMVADSCTKGARKKQIKNIKFHSASYGNHHDIMKGVDLVILSPQVKVYAKEIERDCAKLNKTAVFTNAKEYVQLTNDSLFAIEFIQKYFPELGNENSNSNSDQNNSVPSAALNTAQ